MIRETFYKEKNIECKSTVTDLVTETDKAVEKMIFDTIRESYPDHWLVKYYLDVALNIMKLAKSRLLQLLYSSMTSVISF